MDQAKVFVSSILDTKKEDLGAEREVVREVVNSHGFLRSWAFEHEPASSDPLDESYLQNVDTCDLFVLIVGSEATDPVTKETLRALDRSKPILIFAKKVENRSPQAQLLLKTPNKKYATFESLTDLRQRVQEAVSQTLVKGLKSLQEGGAGSSILYQLREFAAKFTLLNVKPTIPRKAEVEPFQILRAEPDVVEIQKSSSGGLTYVPTSRVQEVLPYGPLSYTDFPLMILNGRLQWVTVTGKWKFFEEKLDASLPMGLGKLVSSDDDHAKTITNILTARGHRVGWPEETRLGEELAKGFEVVYDEDGRYMFCINAGTGPRMIFVAQRIGQQK